MLLLRAILAFLALPALVGFVIPIWLGTSTDRPMRYFVTAASRNPMYIGVVTILAGWSALWASRTLIIYSVSFAIGFHLRVVLYEEPWASRRFGAQWDAYRARVPRWVI